MDSIYWGTICNNPPGFGPTPPELPLPTPLPPPVNLKQQLQAAQAQCVSLQQSYNRDAQANNAKWWMRFYGSGLGGFMTGGPIGAGVGFGIALLYDDSRKEYNDLTNSAATQWKAAGCPGNLKPRWVD